MKAKRLGPGDSVGIVSPSWGGAGKYPHRVERGIRQLEAMGFNVKVGRHALNQDGFVSDTAANRVQDLHEMFLDPDVRLIIAAVGGDHSCHLLPELDFELIRNHPTLLMGYSDITVLNVAIWKETGLVTLNGPCLISEFAEYPEMFEYTRTWFSKVACEPSPAGIISHSDWWTEEFLDWREKKDLERPRQRVKAEGWTSIRGGVGEGVLIGGCLESLQHLRGTRFWPEWNGAILFIETSETAPHPAVVDGILMDYQNMGVFDQIAGLLVGRPMRYSEEQKAQLREVVRQRTADYRFPVLTDTDFGHTAPQFTLPIGCRARIDGSARALEILEAAVV